MKTMNELTLKNLKLNKSRTVVMIIGILLSCALITVVTNIGISFQQTLLDTEIKTSGNYIYSSNYATLDDIRKIQANRRVEDVYVKKYIGFAKLEEPRYEKRPEVLVEAFSKNAFEKGFNIELAEGRLPNNQKEVVLANNFLKNSKKAYKVGDVLALDTYDKYGKSEAGNLEYRLGPGEDMGDEVSVSCVPKEKKEYTIVGIMKENLSPVVEATSYYNFCNVFTLYEGEELRGPDCAFHNVYASYKESELENYKDITAEILGTTPELVQKCLIDCNSTDEEYAEFNKCIQKEDGQYAIVDINTRLISRRGIDLDDEVGRALIALIFVVVVIIMFVSIFVIRNSFALSITEKTKLYGMLASVGATSKQIRNNVLFEGFLLGCVGIPLGIGLGYGVTGGLIMLLNYMLKDFMNGFVIVFGTSIWGAVVAVVSSSLTIFFSGIFTAIRASKISPMLAIRGNLDIKESRRAGKYYKTPKYISSLFGIGGEIAHKNLKRSRKKYRTTVISLVVSVMLFISMASFMEYMFGTLFKEVDKMAAEYNIRISLAGDKTYDECEKIYKKIESSYAIEDSRLDICKGVDFVADKSWYDKPPTVKVDFSVILGLTSEDFEKMVKAAGLTDKEAKGKVLVFYNKKDSPEYKIRIAKDTKFECYDVLVENEDGNIETKEGRHDLVVASTFDKWPQELPNTYKGYNFFMERDALKNMGDVSCDMYFRAEDPDKMEEEALTYSSDAYVDNMDKTMQMLRALGYIVAIFGYGFIIVISLIGITNVFNTISTNMKLRGKEFAMLRSVGMTNREFKRMIRLESLLYGMKSLLIGIPLGVVGNYLIYYAFKNMNPEMTLIFNFPFLPVVICIVSVLLLIWAIMTFSVHKTKSQNIIETIRNDNI